MFETRILVFCFVVCLVYNLFGIYMNTFLLFGIFGPYIFCWDFSIYCLFMFIDILSISV